MKFDIKYKPSYAMLIASLNQGETITAEAGAMTYMDPTIEVHTRKREKSILGSLGLSLIGGQSFWVNDYTAATGPGDVHIQTKNLQEFTQWLWTLLEPKVRNSRAR